jgi:hypothetical protein
MTTAELVVPRWMVCTNRALVTFNGTIAAVMVSQYAAGSGQGLDVALVVAIIASGAFAVVRAHRVVPVTLASVLAMLGLALVPPAWLLALVPPLLLSGNARRHRRRHGGGWRVPRDHDEESS